MDGRRIPYLVTRSVTWLTKNLTLWLHSIMAFLLCTRSVSIRHIFYQISASAKSYKFYECGKVKIVLHNMLVDWHWSLPILIPFVFHREYNQLPRPGHRVNKEVLCVVSSPTLFSVNQATLRVTKYGLKYCILYKGQTVNLSTYFSSVIKMCNNI